MNYALFTQARTAVVAFLTWWVHELADMGAALLVLVAPHLATRTTVTLRGPLVVVEAKRGKASVELLSFTSLALAHARADTGVCGVTDTEWLPEALQAPQPIASLNATRTTLSLDRTFVLAHDLEMPTAVRSDLAAAMRLYIERQLPLTSERLYLDWHVTRTDRQRQRIGIRLLAARRETVDRLHQCVAAWGLRPVRVAFTDSPGEGSVDTLTTTRLVGNLLPRTSRIARVQLTPGERRLGLVAASLATGLLLLLLGQSIYERRVVGKELQRTGMLARQAAELARQFESNSAPAVSLTRTMANADALDVLTTLTKNIPADSWIYDLEVTPGPGQQMRVKLTGFTPTATIFADLLRKTPGLENVRLVSASSAGLGSGKDRLQISATWTRQ